MKKSVIAIILSAGTAAMASHVPNIDGSVTNTSATFSLGYGRQVTFGNTPWTTTESSGVNTPSGAPQAGGSANGTWTFGSFAFSNIVNSTTSSGSGPRFPNRVLTDGGSDISGNSTTWTNTLSVAWTGGIPAGAAPDPSLRIQLNIEQISIYATACCGAGGNTNMSFLEITPDHGASSPSLGLNDVPFGSISLASSYKQLLWDPTDFMETGTNLTRQFVLTGPGSFLVDGFEIVGNAMLIYVPEPGVAVLVAMGLVAFGFRRR